MLTTFESPASSASLFLATSFSSFSFVPAVSSLMTLRGAREKLPGREELRSSLTSANERMTGSEVVDDAAAAGSDDERGWLATLARPALVAGSVPVVWLSLVGLFQGYNRAPPPKLIN